MKKVFNYIRSMRFGILLLVLIAVCSVAGTVIPQGREIAYYAQTYRSFHGVILMLRLHRIFESWYFAALSFFSARQKERQGGASRRPCPVNTQSLREKFYKYHATS